MIIVTSYNIAHPSFLIRIQGTPIMAVHPPCHVPIYVHNACQEGRGITTTHVKRGGKSSQPMSRGGESSQPIPRAKGIIYHSEMEADRYLNFKFYTFSPPVWIWVQLPLPAGASVFPSLPTSMCMRMCEGVQCAYVWGCAVCVCVRVCSVHMCVCVACWSHKHEAMLSHIIGFLFSFFFFLFFFFFGGEPVLNNQTAPCLLTLPHPFAPPPHC